MKGKLLILAVLAVCLCSAGGTAAYFTAQGTARNVITAGYVDIALEEKHMDGSGTVVEFPAEGIHGITPGGSVSKIVTVQNLGADAWIRVKVDCAVTDRAGLPLKSDVVKLTFDRESWQEQDGFFYCRQPVAAGERTPVLFDRVEFSPAMGNDYQNARAVITVTAQAVQHSNNPDALGWPD